MRVSKRFEALSRTSRSRALTGLRRRLVGKSVGWADIRVPDGPAGAGILGWGVAVNVRSVRARVVILVISC